MVRLSQFSAAAATAALAISSVSAHPGEHHTHAENKRELEMHQMYARMGARSLQNCANSPGAILRKERAVARRAALADQLRAKRGIETMDKPFLHRRDAASLAKVEALNHNQTGAISSQDPSDLFSANTSCITAPETTVGPYWVAGELVRTDVTEDQAGIPLHLEIELVDVSTCKPMSASMLVDLWHCNSTGVYSGVEASGGLDTTFNRGVQESDEDGVVQFDTTFPGHYQGRATHIHVQMNEGSEMLPNSTYTGGVVRHIGQFFFDEELRGQVEATEPYASNDAVITTNDEDFIAQGASDNDYDPFVQYVYLGDSIEDGLLAWISVGINATANYTSQSSAAAFYQEGGGVTNPNGMGGPCGGGGPGGPPPGGNGTMGPPPGGMNGTGPGGAGGPPVCSSNATASASATGGEAATATGTAAETVSSSQARRRARIPGKWVRKMFRV